MNNIDKILELSKKYGCKYFLNEPMKNHTTFKIGGPCDVLVSVCSEKMLMEAVSFCVSEKIKYYVIGNGSNLLFDDEGFRGVVFKIGADFKDIFINDDGMIECDSGCTLAKLSAFALNNSITGLEFLFGIPGTVGGAVYMNAGAYGGEICDVINSAKAVYPDGRTCVYKKDELELSYRNSRFVRDNGIITKAIFETQKGDKEEIKAKMDELMGRRTEKQPLEYPSAGSTFKRPVGAFAAKLIEDCGLKGHHVGDAEISVKHSGFVINKGNATFKDVITLIEDVKKTVFEKTGFVLECEVKIIKSE